MTLSSFLLVHRATILRRKTDTDRVGGPVEQWITTYSDVPCRLTAARGKEQNTERMRETYDVSHELFLQPDGWDKVREDDQVTVTDATGRTLVKDARVVLKRAAYAGTAGVHHVEVLLESIRGPM